MHEGAPKSNPKQEQKRSGLVEAGLAAVALMGAVDHGPAQALEIEPTASWSVGVQKLKQAVMQEKNESATVYIRFSDGSGAWPRITEGGLDNVTSSSEGEINYLLEKSKGRKIEQRCDFHTHPHQVFKTSTGNSFDILYSPPSRLDVLGNAQSAQELERVYRAYNMPVKKFESALADTKGVWYYKGGKNTQVTPEQQKAWRTAFDTFGVQSSQPGFDFKTEYPKLQQAYKVNFSADIRFVPYEEISKEPACAGVDYVPGKKSEAKIPAAKFPSTQPSVTPPPPTRPGIQNIETTRPSITDIGPPQR